MVLDPHTGAPASLPFRTRLWAAEAISSQSRLRSIPLWRRFLLILTVLVQPKISSTRLRFRWLTW